MKAKTLTYLLCFNPLEDLLGILQVLNMRCLRHMCMCKRKCSSYLSLQCLAFSSLLLKYLLHVNKMISSHHIGDEEPTYGSLPQFKGRVGLYSSYVEQGEISWVQTQSQRTCVQYFSTASVEKQALIRTLLYGSNSNAQSWVS